MAAQNERDAARCGRFVLALRELYEQLGGLTVLEANQIPIADLLKFEEGLDELWSELREFFPEGTRYTFE